MKRLWLMAILTTLLVGVAATAAYAGPLPGAIFTTLPDGTRVNANIYDAKEDVYLDGGPGPNAPSGAAALPVGDYYFQVTDPSGKELLSVDPVASRMVHVNEYGVIDTIYPAPTITKYQGKNYGTHLPGTDIDHPELGAITVQLMPYKNTPNRGGVYKVWMTPVDRFVGDIYGDPTKNTEYFYGFVPAWSKTDNYKVRRNGGPPEPGPPLLNVLKFHDLNANGVKEALEPYVDGWAVDVTDPIPVTNTYYTPAVVIASPYGWWSFLEATPAGTLQTASYVDGVMTSPFPKNPVSLYVPEKDTAPSHEIVFGDVGLGKIIASKIYDRDGDGVAESDEPGVPGWKFVVTGTLANGAAYGPVTITTGADGSTELGDLLPGSYTLTELIPLGDCWKPSGPVSQTVEIVSTLDGSVMTGSTAYTTFTNYCEGYADFYTKGFWHNKNGLGLLYGDPEFPALLAYINGLDPYNDPTGYFQNGEEPFDGYDEFGNPVPPAIDALNDFGLVYNEISQFLVDPNAGGDPREQLAQQLLAFIFNVKYYGASAVNGMGSPMGVDAMIASAIEAWQAGGAEANYWQTILVGYNESDSVHIIYYDPCPVIYP